MSSIKDTDDSTNGYITQFTPADVQQTAALAADLQPQRISVFGYAHVPWMKKHQQMIDTAALPGAEERLAQAEAVEPARCRAVALLHLVVVAVPVELHAALRSLQPH